MFLISSSFNLPVHLSCVLFCVYFPVPRKHTLTVEEERVILFNTYKKKKKKKENVFWVFVVNTYIS